MHIFEFVLVMASLVLAIGLTSLLSVVASIISHRQVARLEWFPLIWIATLFLYVPGYWWSLWDFRDVSWTFPTYFFLLLMPTCLYIAMRLLGDALEPEDGIPRGEAFERVRVPFFLALILMQGTGALDGWLLSVEPLWNDLRALQVFLILLFIVGALSPRLSVQKPVAALNFLLMVFAMFVLRFLPGAFSS
ncbi:MAG: hypothetical protein R3315_10405 [Woeseiaceae bacterium]|nr:hypothetical protein [Woeseiaceae bacterium]